MTHRDCLKWLLFIPLCMLMTSLYSQQQGVYQKPVDVVKAFYQYHFSHDMGFTESSVKAKEAWFTKDLFDKMVAKLREPVPKGEEPDIDGDPFTCSQEYPDSFKITGSSIKGDKAAVTVQFLSPDRRRTVQVLLLNQPAGWFIDDIVFEKKESLRPLLLPHKDESMASKPNDIEALAKEYAQLRQQKRALKAGEFNKDLSGAGGRLETVMDELGKLLGNPKFKEEDIIRMMGKPDETKVSGDHQPGSLGGSSPGGVVPRDVKHFIYYFRGGHDYLYFVSKGGVIQEAKWYAAGE